MTSPRIEAARIEVERSRAQMLGTAKLLQQRLEPGKLSRDAWQSAKEKGADLAENAVDAVRKRPIAVTSVIAAITLFLAREPLMDLAGKMTDKVKDKAPRKTRTRTKSTENVA